MIFQLLEANFMDKQIIILAAGKGSRMKSALPKVMHEVGGKPMLRRVIDNAHKVTNDLVLVYSKHIEQYLDAFKGQCKFILQEKQLGTAHAVSVADDLIKDNANIGVIYGDNPLITSGIISGLFEHLETTQSALATLVFEHEKPNAYGRIITDKNGNFKKIVEFKLANEEERRVKLCNSGIMVFAPGILKKYLPHCLTVERKETGVELYLTELVQICSEKGEKVTYYTSKEHKLVVGVNTQEELAVANNIMKS